VFPLGFGLDHILVMGGRRRVAGTSVRWIVLHQLLQLRDAQHHRHGVQCVRMFQRIPDDFGDVTTVQCPDDLRRRLFSSRGPDRGFGFLQAFYEPGSNDMALVGVGRQSCDRIAV